MGRYNPEDYVLKGTENKERQKIRREILKGIIEKTFKLIRERFPLIPITEDLRINMKPYQSVLSPKKYDECVNEVEEFKKRKNIDEGSKEKSPLSSGEALEIFKTFILNKYLMEKGFLILRTAEYDDYFNGVDNIIIDMNSGELIAAIDDVATIGSDRLQQKKDRVININLREGVKITFGFAVSNEGNIELKSDIKGLPIILIAVPENILWNLIDNYENEDLYLNFMKYLYELINIQKSELELSPMSGRREEINLIQTRIKRIESLLRVLELFQKSINNKEGRKF